jgi:hypothetical protein
MGFRLAEIPRLRVGMDYVPSDDFPALLHEGESVLTKQEATLWRGMGGASGIEGMLSVQPMLDAIYQNTLGGGDLPGIGTNIESQTLFGKAADYFIVREESDIDQIADALFRRVQRAQRATGGGFL